MKSILLALATFAPQAQGDFRVEPAEVSWGELCKDRFDLAWVLPDRRGEGRDLLGEMQRLNALRFEVSVGKGRVLRSFGDLVAAARAVSGKDRETLLAEVARGAPKLWADWGAGLSELLLDDFLYGERWRPAKDHPRDGILMAEGWNLKDEDREPWKSLKVEPWLEQGAVLFYSDLATLKTAECDYRLYPENVDANYLEIFPLEGSYCVGEDPEGRPFSTLGMKFKSDLPFPFSAYNTKLSILNRFREDGALQTDIYSLSSDFYWLAGRDVYLPVRTSEGEFVALLVVRHFGFDLRGVPDKRDNRREAVRGTLGNLRLNSEKAYSGEPRQGRDFLRSVPLWGNRRKR